MWRPTRGSTLAFASGDRQLAEEATDEAFVRALERWPRVCGMAAPAAWVTTVGLNCIRRAKRRRRLEEHLLRRARPETVAPLAVADPVWAQVASLPARQRTAVALRYLADLTEPEVAAAMGISRGTVASTLADARRRLALTARSRAGAGATEDVD